MSHLCLFRQKLFSHPLQATRNSLDSINSVRAELCSGNLRMLCLRQSARLAKMIASPSARPERTITYVPILWEPNNLPNKLLKRDQPFLTFRSDGVNMESTIKSRAPFCLLSFVVYLSLSLLPREQGRGSLNPPHRCVVTRYASHSFVISQDASQGLSPSLPCPELVWLGPCLATQGLVEAIGNPSSTTPCSNQPQLDGRDILASLAGRARAAVRMGCVYQSRE